jgi:ATP-dependent helicase HrpB
VYVKTSLPIDEMLPEIVSAVRSSSSVILTATPGAGKTTRLPPSLLDAVPGKIAVLEPRRMAAVAACHRVCQEQGWNVGEQAGYQVRFESRASSSTRLLFMTDAMLLRRLVDDPELREFSLIVLDEFHERGLNQDLILGCVRELQELGSELKLLLMSATLDVSRLKRFLPDAPLIEVPGRVFPLEIRHSSHGWSLQTDRDFYDRVSGAVGAACRETAGDVLVFLPGVGEITRLGERLAGLGREIVPLHGSLPLMAQNAVLQRPSRPRVILSTNVAEASVTVTGVDFVIDTGLVKVMEMNLNSGFSSLELSRISQFNARQRAGRAARERAGVCLRLWTPHDEVTQAMEMAPECARVDLSASLLLLAHLGVGDFARFAWFDPPPGRLLGMAMSLLCRLGALDASSRLTDFGRRLMRFPLPPRVGATLAMAEDAGFGRLGAWMSAVMGERDFVERPATTQLECDVSYRLELLREGQGREVLQSARQLERMVAPGSWGSDDDVRRLLLRSQTDRLCRRRGGGGRAVMVGDSTWDCEAAKRAGIETIAVLTGGFSEAELLDAGALAVFSSIAELRERVGQTPLGDGQATRELPRQA